jgi:hypothetical protein
MARTITIRAAGGGIGAAGKSSWSASETHPFDISTKEGATAMQDYELPQDEFGEDFEADSFEFESSDEFDMETGFESPEDRVEDPVADAAAARLVKGESIGALIPAMGALAHRKQSGRWIRRGNTVVLFGI